MYCSRQSPQTCQSRKMLRRAALGAGVAVVNLGILGGVGGSVVNLGGFGFTLPGVAVCEAQAAVYEPFVGVDLEPMILKAADPGFQYICVNTNQQGLKSSGALSKTVMGTLIASKMEPSCVADPDKFMAIKGFYESAAAQYKIIPFNPHPNGCDPLIVCPQ